MTPKPQKIKKINKIKLNNMKHEHKTIKDCEHKNIEHCKKCDVVECLECGKEWKVTAPNSNWVGGTTMLPYQDGTNGVINLCKYD